MVGKCSEIEFQINLLFVFFKLILTFLFFTGNENKFYVVWCGQLDFAIIAAGY